MKIMKLAELKRFVNSNNKIPICKWKDKNNISSSGVEDKSSFQRVLLQVNGNKIYKQYYSGSLFYFGISLKNDYIEKFNKFVEVIDTKPQGL